jgi:hypothetical protein
MVCVVNEENYYTYSRSVRKKEIATLQEWNETIQNRIIKIIYLVEIINNSFFYNKIE